MARIVIDPGHGLPDPGAVGPQGAQEALVVLAFAMHLANFLHQAGHEVALTRTTPDDPAPESQDDAWRSLNFKVATANNWPAHAFISLHCNSFSSPEAYGFEVWTSPGQTPSDDLASCVIAEIQAGIPGLYLRADWSDGDADKEANFFVLRWTQMPAILVELAFISNPSEEVFLCDPVNQAAYSAAIGRGVLKWLASVGIV